MFIFSVSSPQTYWLAHNWLIELVLVLICFTEHVLVLLCSVYTDDPFISVLFFLNHFGLDLIEHEDIETYLTTKASLKFPGRQEEKG